MHDSINPTFILGLIYTSLYGWDDSSCPSRSYGPSITSIVSEVINLSFQWSFVYRNWDVFQLWYCMEDWATFLLNTKAIISLWRVKAALLSNIPRRERFFPSTETHSRGWGDPPKLIWGDWWLHKKSLACTAMDFIQIISVWKLHLEAWYSNLWLRIIKTFYKSYKINLSHNLWSFI